MITGLTLSMENGPQAGLRFHVSVPGCCTIGRASDCDLPVIGVPDPQFVSRYQCRIEVSARRIRIVDLGSRNGTFVNGELIGKRIVKGAINSDWWTNQGQSLNDGDVISFAGIGLRVAFDVESASEFPSIGIDQSKPIGALSC